MHDNHALELAGYLDLLGLPADGWQPTLACLHRLQRAHAERIAFNNVHYVLGRKPRLDLCTSELDVVRRRRGGTCLQQVPVFAAALEAIGFETQLRMSTYVCAGSPATVHLNLLVRPVDDDRRWMCDVGFGVSVLAPVPLPRGAGCGELVAQGPWEQRVQVDEAGHIALMERGPPPSATQWTSLHVAEDTDVPAPLIEAANDFALRGERSPYHGRLLAVRVTDRTRERILARKLEVWDGSGAPSVTELKPSEVVDALVERFGVCVDDDDRAELINRLKTM